MPIESIPPLPIGMPIVDPKTGAATREFAQWWQQLFGNASTLDSEKLANSMATGRLLGRSTAGEGEVEELTLSQALDFIGSAAQGDVLYRGASGWERLGAGTSGLFLKTNGAGANPAWAVAGGSYSGVHIDSSGGSTQSIASTSSTTVTNMTNTAANSAGFSVASGAVTVPSGVSLVRVCASASLSGITAGSGVFIGARLNGTTIPGSVILSSGYTNPRACHVSPPVSVSPGDVISLNVQSQDSAYDVLASTSTFLEVQVLG